MGVKQIMDGRHRKPKKTLPCGDEAVRKHTDGQHRTIDRSARHGTGQAEKQAELRRKFEIPVQRAEEQAEEEDGMEQTEERMEEQNNVGLIVVQKAAEGEEQTPQSQRSEIPIWRKALLTLFEASQYTGLGQQKLREISNDDSCGFVLWNGSKRMLKREKLEEYLNKAFSV